MGKNLSSLCEEKRERTERGVRCDRYIGSIYVLNEEILH